MVAARRRPRYHRDVPLDHPTTGEDPPGSAFAEGTAERLSDRLPRSRRGYDPAATDALLADLVAKHAELEQECDRLREHIARLEGDADRYRLKEELVATTLLAATSFAMKVREAARREAELVLRNASAKAVEDTAALGRLARDRADAERELARLRQLTQEMQAGLANFLKSTLADLRPDAEDAELADVPSAWPESMSETLASALETALQPENR